AGVRQARLSNDWNQVADWARKVRLIRLVGMDPVVNLIYADSPRHTDAYYAERALQAATLDVYRICLKDPGGLLTPERVRTLVPHVLANPNGTHVERHATGTPGLGPQTPVEAAKLGIRTVNPGIPPLANGSALPSVFNVAQNLRALGFAPTFDEAAARAVSA